MICALAASEVTASTSHKNKAKPGVCIIIHVCNTNRMVAVVQRKEW